jgi:hypothetical protein
MVESIIKCTNFFPPINYVIYAKVAEMYIIANNNDNEDIFIKMNENPKP